MTDQEFRDKLARVRDCFDLPDLTQAEFDYIVHWLVKEDANTWFLFRNHITTTANPDSEVFFS